MTLFVPLLLLACDAAPRPTDTPVQDDSGRDSSGVTEDTGDPVPVDVVQVATGGLAACALDVDGAAHCWGRDVSGEATPPAGVFSQISGGGQYFCGLELDGALRCWGDTDSMYGRPDTPLVSFDAGNTHACGIDHAGEVECWGYDDHGETLPPTGRYSVVSAGAIMSCALDEAGLATCWGSDSHDLLLVPTGSLSMISAGDFHVCGVHAEDEDAVCWGQNWLSEATPSGGPFKKVVAGYDTSCGLRPSGEIDCWGWEYGQPAGVGYVDLAHGFDFGCAVTTERKVECWGNNEYGQAEPPAHLR